VADVVTITAPQPQLVVTPGQSILAAVAGSSATQAISVGNHGVGSTLTGIQVSLISRSNPAPYPWLRLDTTSLPDLPYNGAAAFTLTAAPPLGTPATAYQDTAVHVQTDNGGSWDVPLTVYVDTNLHAN